MKKTLSTQFEVKAVNAEQRLICGYAAVHSNLDRVGDVIDPSASINAIARLRSFGDVGVFIGHKTDTLPVGVPLKISADERGLYTETYVFEGPEGDNLLAVASGLQKFGKSLGMSIGYYPKQMQPERRDDRTVRRLMDYDLREYSFAAAQAIANPEALVVGVKTCGGTMTYELKIIDGKHCIVKADDGAVVSSHETVADALAALGALYQGDLPGSFTASDAPDGRDTRTAQPDVKAEWSTAYVNALPDSHFMYVEEGEKDEDGRTVPRSKRHFPYRDKDGNVDMPHLRNAIARIPQSDALSDDAKRALQTRARRMLERMHAGGKTLAEIDQDEWKTGIALDLRSVAYALLDLSDEVITKQHAMETLGQDTKTGMRMPYDVREHVRKVIDRLNDVVKTAEDADRDDDPRAEVEWWRQWVEIASPASV